MVCNWLKTLEEYEKTWTNDLANRRRRKFKVWSDVARKKNER